MPLNREQTAWIQICGDVRTFVSLNRNFLPAWVECIFYILSALSLPALSLSLSLWSCVNPYRYYSASD